MIRVRAGRLGESLLHHPGPIEGRAIRTWRMGGRWDGREQLATSTGFLEKCSEPSQNHCRLRRANRAAGFRMGSYLPQPQMRGAACEPWQEPPIPQFVQHWTYDVSPPLNWATTTTSRGASRLLAALLTASCKTWSASGMGTRIGSEQLASGRQTS
jgi:hypothetical protein